MMSQNLRVRRIDAPMNPRLANAPATLYAGCSCSVVKSSYAHSRSRRSSLPSEFTLNELAPSRDAGSVPPDCIVVE